MWVLNQGVCISGKRHEGISWGPLGWSEDNGAVYRTQNCHIYHYGDIGVTNVLQRDLKYLNYARIDAGHEPLAERPMDRPIPVREAALFTQLQPLDPATVGLYAPFED